MTDGCKKTILLVEDEVLIALSEKSVLESFGYRVVTANSGEKAVEFASGLTEISLVLMDIDLGRGLSGPEAALAILQKRTLPIVFLTSHYESDMVEKVRGITRYGYVIKNSGNFVLSSSIEMAYELFDAHARLEAESEARAASEKPSHESHTNHSRLADCLEDVFAAVDEDLRFTFWNKAAERLYGLRAGQVLGNTVLELFGGTKLARLAERHSRQCLESGEPVLYMSEIESSGELRIFENRLFPSEEGITMIGRDVTKDVRSLEALRKSEELHRTILEVSPDNITLTDSEGAILAHSPAAHRMFGYDAGEYRSRNILEFLIPEDRTRATASLKNMLERESSGVESFRGLRKNGSVFDIGINGEGIRASDGTIEGMLFIVRDITEQKRIEMDLMEKEAKNQALLAEKELLLKEVHHRIKNNMATVGSLLSFQAGFSADPAAAQVLENARVRLSSMMALYDRLYSSPTYGQVSLKDYMGDLLQRIASVFLASERVELRTDIEYIALDERRAATLGIIANELITNSMKHAFPSGAKGVIRICARLREGALTFEVSDDGCGLPESPGGAAAEGFGLFLVENLAKQLDGTITVEREKGTKFSLVFPYSRKVLSSGVT